MRAYLLLIISLPIVLLAALPEYESYSVVVHPIQKFACTQIPKSGIDWKTGRFLRYSDDEPRNFADRYTLGEIGCGTGCVEYCLIDRVSGAVYPGPDFNQDFPNDYHGLTGFHYRHDSRLFIVYHATAFEYPVHVSYYVWQSTNMTLLATNEIRAPK
jgi:hypothetical protein